MALKHTAALCFLLLIFASGIAVQAESSETVISRGEGSQETDVVVLVDTTVPLSLGIELMGGVVAKIIPRNTVKPTTRSMVFTTTTDQQTEAIIAVYEGERALTKDCRKLHSFTLSGITPAPIGMTKIEITFTIDVNGILRLSARDKTSKKSASITIKNEKEYLSEEEIEEKIREAKEFEEEDKKTTEEIKKANDEWLDANRKGKRSIKEKIEKVIGELSVTQMIFVYFAALITGMSAAFLRLNFERVRSKLMMTYENIPR